MFIEQTIFFSQLCQQIIFLHKNHTLTLVLNGRPLIEFFHQSLNLL